MLNDVERHLVSIRSPEVMSMTCETKRVIIWRGPIMLSKTARVCITCITHEVFTLHK